MSAETDKEELARVTAPHFVAGIVMQDDVVTEAAPILKWTIGKKREELRTYFDQKGWKGAIVPSHTAEHEQLAEADAQRRVRAIRQAGEAVENGTERENGRERQR
jgi:hypothetical protein